MRDGVLVATPHGDRSSIGVTDDGTLDVRRIEFFGTWQGHRPAAHADRLNQAPGRERDRALHAGLGAGDAARSPARVEAVLGTPSRAATPNTDLPGPVVDVERRRDRRSRPPAPCSSPAARRARS